MEEGAWPGSPGREQGPGRCPAHQAWGRGWGFREGAQATDRPLTPCRIGTTPTSTASTTVPWPCPSPCCCPRSTGRLGVQGPRPSWTAPAFAVLVSDFAPTSTLPAAPSPWPPPLSHAWRKSSCPSPPQGMWIPGSPRFGKHPAECFARTHLVGSCWETTLKGRAPFPVPRGRGHDGQGCLPALEPVSVPLPTPPHHPESQASPGTERLCPPPWSVCSSPTCFLLETGITTWVLCPQTECTHLGSQAGVISSLPGPGLPTPWLSPQQGP